MIIKHLQSSGTRADSAQSSGGARRDDNMEKCSNQRGVALLSVDTSELKQNVTEEKITSDKDAQTLRQLRQIIIHLNQIFCH